MVIQHCRVRDQRKIVDGVFVVGSRIGDHSGQGGFAARARSGGNSDQQRRFAQDLQQAAHGLHCLLWTGDACAGGFGAVHGAAAAESDHGLRAALQIQCAALFHVVHSGVGHYAVVNCTGDSRLRKGFFQFLCKAQGAQRSVGDEQCTADVLPLQQGGDIRHCRQQFRLPVWQEGQRQAEADLIAAAEKPGKRIHKKTPPTKKRVLEIKKTIAPGRGACQLSAGEKSSSGNALRTAGAACEKGEISRCSFHRRGCRNNSKEWKRLNRWSFGRHPGSAGAGSRK